MNPLTSPKLRRLALLLVAGIGLFMADASANQDKDKKQAKDTKPAEDQKVVGALSENVVRSFSWRCVGPATMSSRITAFAVFEDDPTCYYVASASGGIVKTTNNGITFEHQFDREATVSIGDVCVAPSDRNIVWVGTGENNPRNSVSYGDGVYKSTNGGKTWKNMGLKDSFQIGKILIHPKDPNIVYVGALGRCYGPNPERGVYKTTDGGLKWDRVFFTDDKTGVIDMAMHPTDPDTILVAMYERKRDGHDRYLGGPMPAPYDAYDPIVRFGPNAGIYKTTDGGKSFTKMTEGLPTCQIGRVGLSWHRKDPNIVYAIVDCENIGKGAPEKKDPAADKKKGPVAQPGESDAEEAPQMGGKGGGGGGGGGRPFMGQYGGQQANVQDQQGPDGWNYGGVYRSEDAGKSWKRVNSINPRPMYFSCIRVDAQNDKLVYVLGVSQAKSSDGGKNFTTNFGNKVHADGHALWINPKDGRHMLIGCDGGYYLSYDRGVNWDHLNQMALGQYYHVAMDSKKPYWLYGGLQDNGTWGVASVGRNGRGPVNEDVVSIGGGDGYVCRVDPTDPYIVYFESQDGGMGRRDLRTGKSVSIRPKGQHRFNWNTPYILSSFNPKIYYVGGEFVFKSLDRGDDLRIVSPEITMSKRGSATALSESPKNHEVLWAGTDDGAVWITRDGCKNWKEVGKNALKGKSGLPDRRWVATLEASKYKEGRCYACFDAHRSDDDKPYLFVTEDYGETWTPITNNLPAFGSSRCLREDLENENLLFCGTEFNLFASIDRGKSWAKINNNLPTVDVHEVAIHPTAGEICAATHGRSLWIMDVTALRQMSPEVLGKPAHLFKPNNVIRWQTQVTTGGTNRRYVGTNPPTGAQVYYHLANDAKNVSLKFLDISGATVGTATGTTKKGLNVANWGGGGGGGKGGGGGGGGGKGGGGGGGGGGKGGGGGGGGGGPGGGGAVPAGSYRVVLNVDGQEFSTTVRIENDPNIPSVMGRPDDDPDIGG